MSDDSIVRIRCHPAALHENLVIRQDWITTHIRANIRTNNDPSRMPRPRNLVGPSGVSAATTELNRASPADAAAAAVLFLYIHEAGEHFLIDGINLNQHYAGGYANIVRILQQYVIPWLASYESAPTHGPTAPDTFDPAAAHGAQ